MRAALIAALAAAGGCATASSSPDAGDGTADARASDVDAGELSDGARPDAAPVDASVPPDAAPVDAQVVAGSFTDDSAAEFGAGAFGVTDTFVAARGAVEPVAWYTGGLLQRGSDAGVFTSAAIATWDAVASLPSTGRVNVAWQLARSWGTATPASVGFTDGDNWTSWYEGDIWLEAGTWTFSLQADDHGFLELAPAGTATFQRVASADWPNAVTGTFTAATAGWHPIRVAHAEQTVDAQLTLQFSGPGVAQQVIPRSRLRARVDGVTGLHQVAFDSSKGTGNFETTVDGVAPANVDWGAGNPGDLGLTAADTFSVRWAGQFRVDVGGNYQFRLGTDDGQRLRVDGSLLLDAWDDTTHDQTTSAISLAPGWHDLVVEQTETGGGAQARLSVASGPEFAGGAIPTDRLRPVEGRADRIEAGVNRANLAIPDDPAVTQPVTLAAPAGAIATRVDVLYRYNHAYRSDMEFRLRAPDGQERVIVDRTESNTSGTWTEQFTVGGFVNAPVAGTWALVCDDEVGGDTGTLETFELAVHYVGGSPPHPSASAFESSVRDLGGRGTVTMLTWDERVPAGADVAVRLRTCDTPAACATAAWSAPQTAPGGALPAVGAGRYVQYRVEFTSDGDRAPALDRLRVDYVVTL